MTRLIWAVLALWFGGAAPALAGDPPALANASPQEKSRLEPLIKGAMAEGQLSYWDVVIQPETNEALTAAFLKRYGLPSSFKVNYTLTSSSGMVTRLDQELGADRVTIDVAAIASLPWVYKHVAAGQVIAYDSPELAHYSHAIAAGLAKAGAFAFNGAYTFVPLWNSENLPFKGTAWKDVLGAVPEGRSSFGDSSKSETLLETYYALRPVLGREYFEGIAKMKPNYLVRSEQIASRLVSGEDQMAIFGSTGRAYQFNQRGAALKFIFPSEGVVLLPQETFTLKGSPHPNAARLWIDFILSDEGQKILVEKEALISGRDGFTSPIPDYAPGIDSLKLVPVDWSKVTPEDLQKSRAEWTSIFTP
ncbi:MAG: extracellular solute-binding protein [Alphaproteobacteria bacterium]|nr:extracellular solute-binding protein [Alphaproteobacteria bacterium]